ncbi:Transcription elongation factor A protein 1 [Orchesella cincta]|uniref:Transcription elongation factor n=1 Tax=Orchesella cincta TaxID=48709 RepID=A0A1D2MPI6_ORCCI|nr:Transcription elongation factor A protein 1 [Orchesella cincta]
MSEGMLREVLEIKTKMEGLLELQPEKDKIPQVDPQSAIALLKTLTNMGVTLDVLASSKVGMIVNSLRKKFPDKEVQTLGKSLLKKWKKLIEVPASSPDKSEANAKVEVGEEKSKKRKAHAPSASAGSAPKLLKIKIKEIRKPDYLKDSNEIPEASGTPALNDKASGCNTDKKELQSSSVSPCCSSESDAVRVKCRELLLVAVKGDENYPEGSLDPQELVEQLEDSIFKELKGTGFKYKSRIRSRIANLKDPRNPDLRVMFLEGRISPVKLSTMTAEEMASDELKSLRAQFIKESIENAQLATIPGTKTDLLRCGKCRKRNCTYNQLQTRSADEPMTTFVLCNSCGNRWKFN